MVYECWCALLFCGHYDVIILYFMADVMPYALKACGVPWQMLLPYIVADVIAMLYVVDGITTEGRWYCLLLNKVADKDAILKKSGVIYRYKCDRVECDEEYVGESAKTFCRVFQRTSKGPFPNI